MSHNPTIHTYFDNREGEMILRESSRFFNCEYDPIHKDVRTAFLSKLRSEVKKQELIDSKLTFLCGCCKRPLKIVRGNENGKKCFHFMHIQRMNESSLIRYLATLFNGGCAKIGITSFHFLMVLSL